MLAQRYIQKELSLIDSRYFAAFDPLPRLCGNGEEIPFFIDTQGRWLIRKWKSVHPINQRFDTWRFNSVNILTVNETDEEDNDIGFHPLDRRVIDAMRMGFYWSRHSRRLLQEIDKNNTNIEEKAEAEDEYVHRHLAKMIWKYHREPTFDMGG